MARSPRQIASYASRATLLLLDGQINVGELLRRFGETLPIEEALAELEHEGLVHPRLSAGEEEPVPEAEAAEDPMPAFGRDPLFDPAMDNITEESLVKTAPQVMEELAEAGEVELESPPPSAPRPASRREPILVESQVVPTQFEEPPILAAEPFPVPALEADEIQGEPTEPAAPRRSLGERVRALGAKGRLIGIGAVLLGLVAVLGLWVSGLRPDVERRASQALGVPVAVHSLGLAVQHGPALALENVRIDSVPPLNLRRIEVMPDPRQARGWGAVRLRLDDAALKPSELSSLMQLLGRSGDIGEVQFAGLRLHLGELQAPGLAGSLERDGEGRPWLKLAAPEGGLSLEARASEAALAIHLAASPGTLPFLGRPQIGTVDIHGVLDDQGLRNAELGMTAYGGKFDGSLSMVWAGPVTVESRLKMAAVSMRQVSRQLFPKAGGFNEGIAVGSLSLRARAARWEELTRIDALEASLLVERGALAGFDLGAALRERSPRPVAGGETRFESLRGRVVSGERQIHLMIDRLDSGALTAYGQLTVDKLQSLQGSLNASVQVPGRGSLNYPAELAGTVAQPSIQLRLPASIPSGPLPGGADRSER